MAEPKSFFSNRDEDPTKIELERGTTYVVGGLVDHNRHKVCARVAGQCAERPGFLTKLVTALATAEVLGRECSNDRLVCRLSILGGAARHGPKGELLAHTATWTALLGRAASGSGWIRS